MCAVFSELFCRVCAAGCESEWTTKTWFPFHGRHIAPRCLLLLSYELTHFHSFFLFPSIKICECCFPCSDRRELTHDILLHIHIFTYSLKNWERKNLIPLHNILPSINNSCWWHVIFEEKLTEKSWTFGDKTVNIPVLKNAWTLSLKERNNFFDNGGSE